MNASTITTYKELEAYAQGFANRRFQFLILTSPPGTGKTTTVRRALQGRGKYLDNFASPLGLYIATYEAKNQPIVLDDMGTVSKPSFHAILKSLGQKDAVRTLTWTTAESKGLEKREIPYSFSTSSPVCIIANGWSERNVDLEAIGDRARKIVFAPSALAIHQRALEVRCCDFDVWVFIGENLKKIKRHSMRQYADAMELKQASELSKAGMDWKTIMLEKWGKQTA